jgi:CBS domain containing-hemolysin-like protein
MEAIPIWLAQIWLEIEAFLAVDYERLTDPDIIVRLVIQALLFILSAFYSGSETALFSLSRLDLQKLRRERHPQTDNLHALLDQPRRLIISILCGNELVNVAATANLAGILIAITDPSRAGWINILVMFPLLLLLGEVTPKTIAVSNPLKVSAGLVSAPMTLWVKIVTPLRELIRMISDRVTTLVVGDERTMENILQTEVFRTLVEDVTEEGVLDATERVLIDNLLEACETEIVEIMTPRTQVNFLRADMTVTEIADHVRNGQHPRVPVYRDHRDNLEGFIHAEDIMNLVLDGKDLTDYTLEDLRHPPIVVPPTKNVDEMFDFFQNNRTRAAIVLNEFGGVDGFITMRDVINFIFGEISEDVKGQELYREQDNDVYIVPGQMKLTDFNDLTTFGIEDPRMTTIGGVVFRYLDRLPRVGDKVNLMDGLVATVLEMEGHRLTKVRIAQGDTEDVDTSDEMSAEADEGVASLDLEEDAAVPNDDVSIIQFPDTGEQDDGQAKKVEGS